jgi:hypothetical protein
MAELYADIHCHPSLFLYNRMRNTDEERDPQLFHPWRRVPSNLDHMAEGRRAATYSQSSFPKMASSGTRICLASITPIERGFFQPGDEQPTHPFGREALRLVTGATALRAGVRLVTDGTRGAAMELSRILRNRGPARRALQRLFLRYPPERIRFFLSEEYDYWDDFQREYDFLCRKSGARVDAELRHKQGRTVVTEELEGCYHVVESPEQYTRIVEETDDEIAIVLTIEGAHTFSVGPDDRRVDEGTLFRRIGALKALPHPILFMTLAHHFDNGICGHAHSILDIGDLVMDQSRRMGEGFEPEHELGLRVARALLDLDRNLDDRGGKRILLDIKHMSARTRQQYYAEIVRPYNERRAGLDAEHRARFPKLPVIASHVGYSGVPTLEQQIRDEPREDDNWHVGANYAWSINLSDEDVRAIWRTEGLAGLCFDQRICGVTPGQKISYDRWIHVLAEQLFGMVDVVMLDDRVDDDDKITIWDRICLGTDFDGLIDPISAYSTVLDFDRLAGDLGALLEKHRHTRMIDRIGVDELVEKIAWRNAHDFVTRHLPAACGQAPPSSRA